MFQLRKFLVVNRLLIAVLLIALGIYLGIQVTWYLGWLPIFIALIVATAHFLIGPMTILPKFIENGDVEGAQDLIKRVTKPQWLYKPVRTGYYMLKANLSTMNNDFESAEYELKESLKTGVTDKASEGMAFLQLGFISMQKGNSKEAYEQLKKAVKIGLPDADTAAQAYMQLCAICAQRRDYKACKVYFAKAKAAKPKRKEIVDQLRDMGKQITRMPG